MTVVSCRFDWQQCILPRVAVLSIRPGRWQDPSAGDLAGRAEALQIGPTLHAARPRQFRSAATVPR